MPWLGRDMGRMPWLGRDMGVAIQGPGVRKKVDPRRAGGEEGGSGGARARGTDACMYRPLHLRHRSAREDAANTASSAAVMGRCVENPCVSITDPVGE